MQITSLPAARIIPVTVKTLLFREETTPFKDERSSTASSLSKKYDRLSYLFDLKRNFVESGFIMIRQELIQINTNNICLFK